MKKQNKKLITLLLAGAFCCTAAIGVASLDSVRSFADSEESTSSSTTTAFSYELSKLFTSAALVKGQEVATLELGNEAEAGYRNAVALKWFEGKGDAQYFTFKFAFADANFKTITLSMDTTSSVASEKGKATNKIQFVKDSVSTAENLVLDVSVIADDGAEQKICNDVRVAVGEKLTLALTESAACTYSDQFEVLLSNETVALNNVHEENDETKPLVTALFKNVGANYASYSTAKDKERYPLQFKAETEFVDPTAETKEYKNTNIRIYELNNQSFEGATSDKVEDSTAPVLVVNEEVKGFMLGTALGWNEEVKNETVPPYVVIDVLKTSYASADKAIEYYQYNPTTEITNGKLPYKTFDFANEFAFTRYTKPDGTSTTVYAEEGEEYVSIRFTLSDTVNKFEYQLAWYADSEGVWDEDENYILLNRTVSGVQLAKGSADSDAYVRINETEKVNEYLTKDSNGYKYVLETEDGAYENSELKKFVDGTGEDDKGYNGLLATKAAEIYAGSNAKMYFPSLEHLFYDDNGYRNLSFVICYKTKDTTSSKTVNSYNELYLEATKVGNYQVKIFAKDKADNGMKFYLDKELVDVSVSNIWDIDAIPTFEYTVKSQGLKVQNEDTQMASSRNTTKALDTTYTFSGVTIVGGAQEQVSEFALFRVNIDKWISLNLPASTAFTSVNYKEIREYIAKENLLAKVAAGEYNGDYFEMYLDVYATKLAEDIHADKANIKSCFEKIEKYNSRITEDDKEWEEYNKYEFGKSSNSSFKVADDGGVYIMFADYYDDQNAAFSRVAAYKVIKAEEKADVIQGETQWLKNNLVSIILFSIAAVMLVLIIILLLIKPSDETLEDVDEKVNGKKAEKESKK